MGTMDSINRAVKDATGIKDIEKKAYFMRAGDQSFYGIGVPSVAVRAYIPEGSPHRGQWIGGSGGAWWWHSAFDTLDKGDRDHLLRDMRMEALAIYRSVNSPVIPFDFTLVADMYEETITEIQTQTASGTFNLNPILDRVREMKTRAEGLNGRLEKLPESPDKVNDLLIRTSRILTSTYYTQMGPFDQDSAYGIAPLPTLQSASSLTALNPGSDEAGFLRTKMIRERNRICKALESATELMERSAAIAG
jgi:hypothetical protein